MFAFVRRNEGVLIGIAGSLIIVMLMALIIGAVFVRPEKTEVLDPMVYSYVEFNDLEGNLISGKVSSVTRSDFSDSYQITLDNGISYVVPQEQVIFSSEVLVEETSILNSER